MPAWAWVMVRDSRVEVCVFIRVMLFYTPLFFIIYRHISLANV